MKLEHIRRLIDRIDGELLRLVEQRLELCVQTRRLKRAVLDPERERAVIERAASSGLDLVAPEFSSRLLRSIMSESRRLQDAPPRLVGFQGEHGAYSEAAARRLAPDAVPIPVRTFEDLVEGLRRGTVDLAIFPVHNSTSGRISAAADLLASHRLRELSRITLPVRHCLLAPPDAEPGGIRHVYSHPEALGQCRSFIARHGLTPRPHDDTAGAARMLARERPRASAALASRRAAALYDLAIVRDDVSDRRDNETRFVLVGLA